MRSAAITLLFVTVSLVLASIKPVVAAGNHADIQKFLAPVAMQIVMRLKDGYIVDKGSLDGVHSGDILAVVASKKRIKDPATGKVIDTLVDYSGFLRVTESRAKLSYCTAIGSVPDLAERAEVRRFEHVPVFFEDVSGQRYSLFQDLRDGLPGLSWQGYVTTPFEAAKRKKPFLLIRAADGQLSIVDDQGNILFVQPVAVARTEKPAKKSFVAVAGSKPPRKTVSLPGEAIEQGEKLRKIPLSFKEALQIIRVGDFDTDGVPEVLIGLDTSLHLGRLVADQFSEKQVLKFSPSQRLIDISVVDLDGQAGPEIAVSLVEGTEGKSKIYRFVGGELVHLQDLPLLTGMYQPAAGDRILIGIRPQSVTSLRPEIYRITMANGKLSRRPFPLVGANQPYGIAPLVGGGAHHVTFSPSGRLKVLDPQGKVLWESPDSYGGSSRGIKIPQPGLRNVHDFEKYFFYSRILPLAQDIFLVSEHEGSGWLLNYPVYKKGRLVGLEWTDGRLEKVSRTRSVGGMIADFDRYDLDGDGALETIAAVVAQRNDLFKTKTNSLVIFP